MLSGTADTNIWISAFNYGGNPRRPIEMADSGFIEEMRRILGKRFTWPPDSYRDPPGIGFCSTDRTRVTLRVQPNVWVRFAKNPGYGIHSIPIE